MLLLEIKDPLNKFMLPKRHRDPVAGNGSWCTKYSQLYFSCFSFQSKRFEPFVVPKSSYLKTEVYISPTVQNRISF